MYGGASEWRDWARQKPQVRLYNYYILGSDSGTVDQSKQLLQGPKLRNIFPAQLDPQQISHHQVPITFLKTRIQQASFLKDK
jgi:hypothetical protein